MPVYQVSLQTQLNFQPEQLHLNFSVHNSGKTGLNYLITGYNLTLLRLR